MIPDIFNSRPKRKYLLGLAAAAGLLGISVIRHRRARQAERWQARLQIQPARTALITGASSGIGQAFALRLAALEYNVVLVARREARLKELAEECRLHFGVRAEVIVADLSIPEGIEKVEQRIASGGDISFLVNNAGFSIYGDFADVPVEGHQAMLNCLTLASVRFCKAALPGMLARNSGAIVNVSSIGAFVPKPKDVTYEAAKAYLITFSEALQEELANTQVRVQALAPGLTLSEFHDHPQYAGFRLKQRVPHWLWMTPDEVVYASLSALGENRVVCIPGFKNRLVAAAGRFGLTTALINLFGDFFQRFSAGLNGPRLEAVQFPPSIPQGEQSP